MKPADLIGRWTMVRSLTEQPTHAIEFTVAGDLVYSNPRRSGLERVLLTFELDGGELITDQPFAPRTERIGRRIPWPVEWPPAATPRPTASPRS